MGGGRPCLPSQPCKEPHTHGTGSTYAILRLCALLKPAKEALRPMTPTAPASPEDRNRTLTDMAVTYREDRRVSLVSANRGLRGLMTAPERGWPVLSPAHRAENRGSVTLGNLPEGSGRSEIQTQVSVLWAGVLNLSKAACSCRGQTASPETSASQAPHSPLCL